MTERRRAIAWRITAALAVVIVIFAAWLWAWDAFGREWWDMFKDDAEPWVAIGTILLAAGTFALATRSRQEVRAVLEQTAAARDEVELARRPREVASAHV